MKNLETFTKENITLIIIDEWNKSKLGVYLENNQPQWFKDIASENYSPITGVAVNSANRIVNIKV